MSSSDSLSEYGSETSISEEDIDLPEVIMDMQEENYKLREQIKKLTVQSNTEQNDVVDEGKKRDKQIAMLGRKYSLMVGAWLDTSVFANLDGRPNVDPYVESRYANKKSRKAGLIAELYDFIPKKLHKYMENHSQFASIFRTSLQGQRSNAILSVRMKAGVLFGLNQIYFDVPFDRKSVPELQSLLKAPGKDEYTIFAPILFENCEYHVKHKNFLKNPLLPRIARTMLFGRSTSTNKPQTLAEIWKITRTTPGLIAISAIMARFLISPDEHLLSVGKQTGIKWSEDFESYKGIVTGKSKKIDEIFSFFDEIVFQAPESAKTADTSKQTDESVELQSAMRLFHDDVDEDSDDHTQDERDVRDEMSDSLKSLSPSGEAVNSDVEDDDEGGGDENDGPGDVDDIRNGQDVNDENRVEPLGDKPGTNFGDENDGLGDVDDIRNANLGVGPSESLSDNEEPRASNPAGAENVMAIKAIEVSKQATVTLIKSRKGAKGRGGGEKRTTRSKSGNNEETVNEE